jgi:hypothetical protein
LDESLRADNVLLVARNVFAVQLANGFDGPASHISSAANGCK